MVRVRRLSATLFVCFIVAASLGVALFATGTPLVRLRTESPRSGHAATLLASGRVLVTGGERGGEALATTEAFDPATGAREAGPALAFARSGHTATRLGDGRVLIAGGHNGQVALDSVEAYNPATNAFAIAGRLATPRSAHVAVALADGRVLFAGGDANGTAEIFDGRSSTSAGRMNAVRFDASAVLLRDGRVLIAGGRDANGTAADTAEIFDPVLGTFHSIRMRTARLAPFLGILPDGKVQVIGGDDAATLEIFNPAPSHFTALTVLKVLDPLTIAGTNARFAFAHADQSRVDAAVAAELAKGAATQDATVAMAIATGRATADALSGGRHRASTSPAAVAAAPWVTTDKSDYHPGEHVTITGGGFEPGETVTLVLQRNPETTSTTTLTAVAGALGHITNSDYLVLKTDANVTFALTATGTSGRVATTSFTDSLTSVGYSPSTLNFTFDGTGTTHTQTYSFSFSCASGDIVSFSVSGIPDASVGYSFSPASPVTCTGSGDGTTLTLTQNSVGVTPSNSGAQQTFNVSFTGPGGSYGGGLTYSVLQASQSITFGALGGKTYGDADFTVSASASSGLTPTFSSTTPSVCTIVGGNGSASPATVHIAAAGGCTIRASQSGNTNYSAASNVDQSFTVAQATPVISVGSASGNFGGTTGSYSATVQYLNNGSLANVPDGETVNFSATGTSTGGGNVTINCTTQTTTSSGSAGCTSGNNLYSGSGDIRATGSPYASGIKAAYAGDSNIASGTATNTLTVNVAPTTLVASNSSGTYGDVAVGMSATLTYQRAGSATAVQPATVNFGFGDDINANSVTSANAACSGSTNSSGVATCSGDLYSPNHLKAGSWLGANASPQGVRPSIGSVGSDFSSSPTTTNANLTIGKATPQAVLTGGTATYNYQDNNTHVYTDAVAATSLWVRGVVVTDYACAPCTETLATAGGTNASQITAIQYAGSADDGCTSGLSAWQSSAYPNSGLTPSSPAGKAGHYAIGVSTTFTGLNATDYIDLVHTSTSASNGVSCTNYGACGTLSPAKAGIFVISQSPQAISGTFTYGLTDRTYGDSDFTATARSDFGSPNSAAGTPTGKTLSWATYDSGGSYDGLSPSQYCHVVSTSYNSTDKTTSAVIRIDHATPSGVQCKVRAYYSDCDLNYAESNQTFSIAQALPVVTWATPADITQGTALSGTQLNASTTFTLRGDPTAVVSGTYNYFPAAGTILAAGPNQTLSVTFTAGANTRYAFGYAPYNVGPYTDFITPNDAHVYINVLAATAAAPYCGSYHSGTGTLSGATGTLLKAVVSGAFHGGTVNDLVTSSAPNGSAGKLLYYKGNGDSGGTFAAATAVTATTGTWGALATGNFGGTNGDIAAAEESAGKVYIYKNNGATPPVFSETAIAVAGVNGISASAVPRGIAVANMTGHADGQQDLVVTMYDAATGQSAVVVLKNSAGIWSVQTPLFLPAYYGPFGIGAGDFDKDGKMDVAVADFGTTTSISVLYGDNAGAFTGYTDWTAGTGPSPRVIAVGDINGDGNSDVVVGCYGVSTNTGNLYKLMGTGTGGFTSTADATKPSGTLASVVRPSAVVLADIDLDGDLDCAAVSYSGAVLSIYLNKGDAKATYQDSANNMKGVRTTPVSPMGIAIGTFDNESRPDLAVVGSTTVSRYLLNVAATASVDAASRAITITAGQTATIKVNLTGTGPYTVKYTTSATGSTVYSTSTSSTTLSLRVAPSATTTYTFVSVAGAASCSGAVAATPANAAVVTVN